MEQFLYIYICEIITVIAFSKALNLAEATKTLKNTQLIQ